MRAAQRHASAVPVGRQFARYFSHPDLGVNSSTWLNSGLPQSGSQRRRLTVAAVCCLLSETEDAEAAATVHVFCGNRQLFCCRRKRECAAAADLPELQGRLLPAVELRRPVGTGPTDLERLGVSVPPTKTDRGGEQGLRLEARGTGYPWLLANRGRRSRQEADTHSAHILALKGEHATLLCGDQSHGWPGQLACPGREATGRSCQGVPSIAEPQTPAMPAHVFLWLRHPDAFRVRATPVVRRPIQRVAGFRWSCNVVTPGVNATGSPVLLRVSYENRHGWHVPERSGAE